MATYDCEQTCNIFSGLMQFETRDVFLQMSQTDAERYLRIGQHLNDVIYLNRLTIDKLRRVFVQSMRILRRYLVRYGTPSEVLTDEHLIRRSKSIEISDLVDTQMDRPPSIN